MGKWPMVKLREVLEPVSRSEKVDPAKTYHILGAHWYAGGLYTKDIKTGAEIQANSVYRVEKDDFVYNRLFAWKGSFAIATEDNHGCYVSNEFPCFHVKTDRLLGSYLGYFFKREVAWTEALGLSTGGTPTSRNRLKVEKLLGMEIPLPPLAEQRRIVARIDALAAKIEEARGLRKQADNGYDKLLVAMAHRSDISEEQKKRQKWLHVQIGEIVELETNAVHVSPDKAYPNLGIYSFARGLFKKPPIEGLNTSAKTLYQVRSGRFIYSRLFAFEGAYGIVTDEYDQCYVSNEYPTFICNPDRAIPEFLYAFFKAPFVWADVAAGSKGLGDRRQRVQPSTLLAYRLMLPPLEWQLKIKEVMEKRESLITDQSTSAAELDALLPSVLDRAFKGER